MEQEILSVNNNYSSLIEYLHKKQMHKILIVCGKSFNSLKIKNNIDNLTAKGKITPVCFTNFSPNPDYNSVVNGVEAFKRNSCDSILAVGGGSAIDVAKCIKLYANMPKNSNYLTQQIITNDIPFVAIPTTAGTGSEATKYAVIYYKGEKQSVADESCIPSAVLFDSSVLDTLPEYQRKVTMLDAFCHAVESFWSVNSSEKSRIYSKEAIQLILANYEAYLKNEPDGNKNMLIAANTAGKAINITQTTAGHAMCYKLTSLYGIAHGHAAALCVSVLWPYMIRHTDLCIDSRGKEYLDNLFLNLALCMNCKTSESGVLRFSNLLNELNLGKPKINNDSEFKILKKSVNPVRLKNNPVKLGDKAIDYLYHQIIGK